MRYWIEGVNQRHVEQCATCVLRGKGPQKKAVDGILVINQSQSDVLNATRVLYCSGGHAGVLTSSKR